jgi:DNA-binding transcriptional MerR regulator
MSVATAQEETAAKPLRIGAVCRVLSEEFPDISISKIRFLEDQDLLSPQRTPGGYRLYGEQEMERLRMILRLQRDEFLPLRVIRQELQAGGVGREVRRRRVPDTVEDRRRMTLDELARETGADKGFLRELEEFDLIERGPDGAYGELEADIVRICLQMSAYGLGPRHLRQFHTGVLRAAGLIEGVVAPSLRSRSPERREAGQEDLAVLARLTADLTERILVRVVHAATGSGL